MQWKRNIPNFYLRFSGKVCRQLEMFYFVNLSERTMLHFVLLPNKIYETSIENILFHNLM